MIVGTYMQFGNGLFLDFQRNSLMKETWLRTDGQTDWWTDPLIQRCVKACTVKSLRGNLRCDYGFKGVNHFQHRQKTAICPSRRMMIKEIGSHLKRPASNLSLGLHVLNRKRSILLSHTSILLGFVTGGLFMNVKTEASILWSDIYVALGSVKARLQIAFSLIGNGVCQWFLRSSQQVPNSGCLFMPLHIWAWDNQGQPIVGSRRGMPTAYWRSEVREERGWVNWRFSDVK